MVVIAGVVGFPAGRSATTCTEVLCDQGPLGRLNHEIQNIEKAAFGVAGAEPHSVVSRGHWLLAGDLRLDNVEELHDMLGLHSRRCASQTELLHAAWTKWEANVFDRLIGDYAFALYDQRTATVTLARDPTGQRPLFFKVHGSAIALASLPSGLKNALAPSNHNLSLLARNLENRSGTHGESHLEHVQKVEPGEVIQYRCGNVSRRYHWKPDIDQIPKDYGDDYVADYREVLEQAVGSRLWSRPLPVGSQLSSGLDSSAVTSTAARLTDDKAKIIAFTAAPHADLAGKFIRHRFADESLLAAETAKFHGIRHVIIRNSRPVFDVVREEAWLLQAPVLDPFNMAWWTQIRREAAQLGVRTLLTGELGNLTLNAGSLDMLAGYICRGSCIKWFQEAWRLSSQPNVRWRGIMMGSFGGWIPEQLRHVLRRHWLGIPLSHQLSFIRPEWRARIGERTRPTQSLNPYQGLLGAIRQMDYGLQRKASIAGYDIDELDPLSDRRILDFAFRVPPEQFLRDGETRALARAALRDRVPASVLRLPVRGLQSADWYLRLSKQEAREVFETISPHSNVQDLLNLSKIDQAIQNWPTSDFNTFENLLTYRVRLAGALAAGVYLTQFMRNADS